MDIKKRISEMTLEQKASMLSGRDFWSTCEYEDLGIRSLYLSDGPHGLRKQAAASDHLGLNKSLPSTCFPTACSMASSFDEELGERLGRALGEEASALNVDVLLGPGLNIKRNPLCGRNFEYFSEDPLLAGKMSASYVRGIQSQGVVACVKHFAVNNREYRRMTNDCIVDERTLREIYLRGFEIAVKEGGARSVMSSYNKLNGVYTNENPYLMREVLRKEWGFDGVVITDWGGCNDRVEGLKCGNELEMPVCKYGVQDVIRAVREGEISEELLDENLERLFGLMEYTQQKKCQPFDEEEHHTLARECAENSAVLLENDGVLPLRSATKVAVVGDFAFSPRYQGAGSSIVNPIRLSRGIDCLKNSDLEIVGAERGFHRFGKKRKKWYSNALKLAEKAEVTLFFAGLDEYTEAEGLDRENMRVPQNQITLLRALIEAGNKVVVILHCGCSVETEWLDGASAVLWAGLGGQAGAEAVVNILTGKKNPCGKLAETWWRKYEDCPTSAPELFPGGEDITVYKERLFVGYRGVQEDKKPRYPFGHGLSYTRFAYGNLTAEKEGVRFTLKNIGDRAGKEIALVFYGKKESVISRPQKQLCAFKCVYLEAGEEKEVFLPFDKRTFAYYDIGEKKWQTEEGEYQIFVGSSVEDIKESVSLYLEGVKVEKEQETTFAEFTETPKKRGMTIHENSTVNDLRYAKGWVGRLFSWAIRFSIKFCILFGNKAQANTLIMGVVHQPVRGLAKFGGMSRKTMEGLLLIFNGKLFKGLKRMWSKNK